MLDWCGAGSTRGAEMQFVIMFALDRDWNETLRLMNCSLEVERKVVDQDSTPAHSSEVWVCLRPVWTAVDNWASSHMKLCKS